MDAGPQTEAAPGPDGPVLLCFDGSDNARGAIETAGRLLKRRHAIVVSVWQPAVAMTPLDLMGDAVGRFSGLYEEMDDAGSKLAADQAAEGVKIATAAGFDARPLAVEGAATWAEIVRVAERERAEAVVLGARGLKGVGSVLLGSVSARVLQHCGRPVLVIPAAGDRSRGSVREREAEPDDHE